ncbi:9456_t:CDS:2, partial [Dentiscutata heterogama]
SIDYVERIPNFIIEWIYNNQKYIVVSQTSPSDASNKYCNVRKKTAFSGILVFGLQLYEELIKAIQKKSHSRCVKPLSDLSNYSYRNRTKRAAKNLFDDFEAKKNKIWNPKNNPRLKKIVLEAGKQPWVVKFDEDQQLEKKKARKIVQSMDQSNISRRGYRALTVASQDLPKEWLISREKHKIDEIMQKHIPLLEYDMIQMQNNDSDDSDELDELDELDSEKITNTLEKGGY